jgi:predicted transposase YbfD/YdcC
VVAIDGKSLRGKRESAKKTLVHMVSVWANFNNLVLGQQRVDEEFNEYFISSPRPVAARLISAIRQHWGIENTSHRMLDAAFHEEVSRNRAGDDSQNFSRTNRILLKQNKTSKLGIKGKHFKADGTTTTCSAYSEF